MKEFMYKCFGFELSQMRWFRKWYGGTWSQVDLKPNADIQVWVKGYPNPTIYNTIGTESY